MNVYEIVQQKILAELKKGTVPWCKPWCTGIPQNIVSKRPYSGINLFLLPEYYELPFFLTFKQCKEIGGNVKKGQSGHMVVFWSVVHKEVEETEEEKTFFNLRYYTVFNVDQCELPEEWKEKHIPKMHSFKRLQTAENIIAGYENRPSIVYKGNKACYIPTLDTINMPPLRTFKNKALYYSTLFHECTHSTGHETRLNRDLKNWFGSEEYGKEELIAEIGAGYLCTIAGIHDTIKHSAAYIHNWSKVISESERFFVYAASAAEKAAKYILGEKQEFTE